MECPGEKLLIKLWETLTEKGLGSLLLPWQIQREGRAKINVRCEELEKLAQAKVNAADIRAGRKRLESDGSLRLLASPSKSSSTLTAYQGRVEPTIDIQYLAEIAVGYKEAQVVRQEINVCKAIIHAEEVLAQDAQTPPERPIEDDWLFTWRDYAGKVSTEELQQLWGKVLAGEVKSPGTYSIRTLEFLRGLSKHEAEQISKLASFVIRGRIVHNDLELKQCFEENCISFDLLLTLQDLGVLSGVGGLGLAMTLKSASTERFLGILQSNGKVLLVEHEDPAKVLTLNVYAMTTIGSQLLGLGSFHPNIDYLRLVGKEIIKKGFTVKLADWKQLTENQGEYSNAEKIDA